MLQFIQKKLRDQKLLNGCLFFGIVILVAVLSLVPMFEGGALDDVIQYDFENLATENERYPSVISRSDKYQSSDFHDEGLQVISAEAEGFSDKWNSYLELPVISKQVIYRITGGAIDGNLASKKNSVQIGTFNEMEKRLQLTDIDPGFNADTENVIPCYMSKYIMEEQNLTIGETVTFAFLSDAADKPLRLYIAGIAEEKYEDDYYWYMGFRKLSNMLVVSEENFDHILQTYDVNEVNYDIYEMLDYRYITNNNIRATEDLLVQFQKIDAEFKCDFIDLLDHFTVTKNQVKVVIVSILIPLIVLLLIFIYMVSDRITDAEEMEINVLRSRGISRGTIIKQYILKSFIITAVAVIPGVLIGYVMCKAGASSVDFLTFVWKETPSFGLRPEVLIYIAAAFPVAIILMIIPIIKVSRNTTLSNRGRKTDNGRNGFVERYYIDIVLLGISLYLLYNYNRQRGVMVSEILAGKVSDPMCLIDAELFTFGAAFFLIRISRLVITIIFRMREKKWKPATLAAFLEVIRTRRKSWVISIFLIITIAMGIYNANLAKTVNSNKRERLSNDIGTDAVVVPFTKVRATGDERRPWSVTAPDYSKLLMMKDEGIATEMTQVYRTENLTIQTKGGKVTDVQLFAINTMEFGKTSDFDIMLNDHHWFDDLNALTKVHNGVIISENMAEDYKLSVGDTIDLKMLSPVKDSRDSTVYSVSVQVVGILSAFPGYEQYRFIEDEKGLKVEKENYLAVINDAELKISFGDIPPEIWMKLAEGKNASDIEHFLDEQSIKFNRVTCMNDELDKVFSSAVILITNGLFNISFIVSMIICVIGFLIYWLTSIHSRQMYFGVYRAMGLGMKGINSMLIKEHIFSTMTSLISSIVVGILTSALFIRLISCIYLPEKHSIPLKVFMSYSGFIRIGIIMIAVIIICMFIIVRFIRKMNITEAIKMGEQ